MTRLRRPQSRARSDRLDVAYSRSIGLTILGALLSLLSVLIDLLSGPLPGIVTDVVKFGDDVTVDFYRQTTQIIPVLLLALAIERRVFDVERQPVVLTRGVRAVASVGALGAVVTAELLSLYAIARDEAAAFFFPITASVLVALLVLVVIVALGVFDGRRSQGSD